MCAAGTCSLSSSQNEQAFEEVFQNANFNTYEFKIRVKLETYNVSILHSAAIGDGFHLSSLWAEVSSGLQQPLSILGTRGGSAAFKAVSSLVPPA